MQNKIGGYLLLTCVVAFLACETLTNDMERSPGTAVSESPTRWARIDITDCVYTESE